MSESVKEFM